MYIIDNYVAVLKKYAEFNGRATRSEFWYFVLANAIISILLGFISNNLGSLYNLAVIVPSVAVGARRLHDTNRSGWMQLIALIPLVGPIWLIILLATKGDGNNQYGKALQASVNKSPEMQSTNAENTTIKNNE